jgi:hypothetical protein
VRLGGGQLWADSGQLLQRSILSISARSSSISILHHGVFSSTSISALLRRLECRAASSGSGGSLLIGRGAQRLHAVVGIVARQELILAGRVVLLGTVAGSARIRLTDNLGKCKASARSQEAANRGCATRPLSASRQCKYI